MDPPELTNYTVQHALEILYLETKIRESPTCNATMCNCTIGWDKLVITVDCSNKGPNPLIHGNSEWHSANNGALLALAQHFSVPGLCLTRK